MMDVSALARRRPRVACRRGSRLPHQSRDVRATTIKGAQAAGAYDIAADSKNNLYGAARGSDYVWRVDAKTQAGLLLRHSRHSRAVWAGVGSGMRRGITDAQDRLWWGGYDGNFIGMVDPAAAGRQGNHALSGARAVVLPLRRALRQRALHVDRGHLCRPRRENERETRASGTSTCFPSRPISATSICSRRRKEACRDSGSATPIRPVSRWWSRSHPSV